MLMGLVVEEDYGTADIELDCLLPNGILLEKLRFNRWNTVKTMKEVMASYILINTHILSLISP